MAMVTILMNCYNGEQFLREALDSVASQTYRDWCILFWDNQSTDGSAAIARQYASLEYVRARRHTSLGEARNLALECVRTPFVAFLDCDDVWTPEKLACQMQLFAKNPRLVAVYSDSYFIDAVGKTKGTMFSSRRPYSGMIYARLICEDFIPLLTVVARTDVLRSAGGFRSEFHHAEDWDLFLRMARLGPFDFVPECTAKYRVHANSFHLRNWVLMTAEEIRLLEQNAPLIRQLPAHEKDGVRWKALSLHLKLAAKRAWRESLSSAFRGLAASRRSYFAFCKQLRTTEAN